MPLWALQKLPLATEAYRSVAQCSSLCCDALSSWPRLTRITSTMLIHSLLKVLRYSKT